MVVFVVVVVVVVVAVVVVVVVVAVVAVVVILLTHHRQNQGRGHSGVGYANHGSSSTIIYSGTFFLCVFHRFCFPAQLVGGFAVVGLLGMT